MSCPRKSSSRLYIAVALALGATGSIAAAQNIIRVSVDSSGIEADDESFHPGVCAGGRYVVFDSLATNLVPGGSGGFRQVYLHDVETAETIIISVNGDGEPGDPGSSVPGISGDGRYVVFSSSAGNLIPGDDNNTADIFVCDMVTEQLELVSVSSEGDQGNGSSTYPSISADGRMVAFRSGATNLVPGDTNNRIDVFVHDRDTGLTKRVSVNSSGQQADRHNYQPRISADGRYVVFYSDATNLVPDDTNSLTDVFVHDLQTDTTERVSISTSGDEGNHISVDPSISGDGRYVAFESEADNLVSDDTNGKSDIFLRDRFLSETTRVNVSSTGEQANDWSRHTSISSDGRYVLFGSLADNLVEGDYGPWFDVYVRDCHAHETRIVSVSVDGGAANGHSGKDVLPLAIAPDGACAVFESEASNLVPDDTNGVRDVFVAAFGSEGEPPNILEQPTDQAVCAGEDATFTVVAEGPGTLEYQWRKDDMDIPEANETFYTIYSATVDDAGVYQVLVSNEYGSVLSEPARLTVGTTILEQPSSDTACQGGTAIFSVRAMAPEPITYQWRKDGADIPGATGDTYTIDPVDYTDAGVYDVVVTSPCGSETSTPATLTVIDAVVITVHPTDQTICAADSLTLSVGATGGGTLSYQWRKDEVPLEGETDPILHYEQAWGYHTGEYDVVVSNECIAVISEPATVIVSSGVVILEHPVDREVCEGESVMFTVVAESVAPLSYQWRKNGEDIPGATEPTYTIESVTWEHFGQYQVIVSDVCGPVGSEIAELIVRLAPTVITPPQSQEACQGATVTFTVVADGTPPLSYQWRKNTAEIPDATDDAYTIEGVTPDDAGDYDVIVSNECGAVTSDIATLTVTDDVTPTIIAPPESQTVCVGDAATFEVVAEGTNLEYQWRKFDPYQGEFVDIPGAIDSTFTIDPVTLEDRGSYDVVVSNVCGSAISPAAVLRVDDGTLLIVEQPEDQTGCETASASFSVIADGTPPLWYQWRKDGSDIPEANSSTLTLDDLTFDDAGMYDVVVTSACTEVTSDPAELTVIAYDPPVIITQPYSQVVCEGDAAVLFVEATGAEPLDYQWRRDGGDIPDAIDSTYVIDPFTANDVGAYDVIVSNYCDSTISDVAILDIARLPIITRQPIDRTVAVGEGVTFIVEAIGEPLQYQWQKDGEDIPDATGNTYTIDEVAAEDQGQYAAVVSNACGPATSDTVTLTLVEPPRTTRVSIGSTGAEPEEDCAGAAISGGGRYVTFSSRSKRLVPRIPGDHQHVFLHDRQSASTTVVDMNPYGVQTNDDSPHAVGSSCGGWIAFESVATNIVPGDTNGARDVFLLEKASRKTVRMSAADTGEQGNADSAHPSIAWNGLSVAFHSDADNLVPGDTNGVADVFVYGRESETLTRVSVSSAGEQGEGGSRWASISDDGRFVAFESDADNLVPDDNNGLTDVFLHDRDPDENGVFDEGNGVTYLISVALLRESGNGSSARPALSADGDHVAFESVANNLVTGDTNEAKDVFARDWVMGTTVLVSRAEGGTLGNGDSYFASASEQGRHVAFLSEADNLVADDTNGHVDVFLVDRDPDENGQYDEGNQTTVRASVASNGTEANGDSDWPVVSHNGGLVLFASVATTLVDGDTNGRSDVFSYSVATANTYRRSVNNGNEQGNGDSLRPSMSGGNQYVLFTSAADNLVSDDYNEAFDVFSRNIQLDETELWTRGWVANASSSDGALSGTGRYVVFESYANNLIHGDHAFCDIFVHDLQTGVIERVSVNSAGEPADGNSRNPAISADGRYIAFASGATNLVADDTNETSDVFVHDRQTGTTVLATLSSTGEQASGASNDPVISADGRHVAFHSVATNLVPDDSNLERDVFVRDLQAGTTSRVSVRTDGVEGNGESLAPTISGDGRYAAFMSWATNFAPPDDNEWADVFVHDLQTGVTTLVSANPDGEVGDDGSGYPALSFDGRYVTFDSGARDLVPNDDNFRVDVFVRDIQTQTTTIVSVDDEGFQGDAESSRPAMSSDGRYITFASEATNLVAGDTNQKQDVLVRDGSGCLAPFIIEHPQSQTVYTGQTFTLTVVAGGSPTLSYQWRKDGEEIPGAIEDTLTIELPTDEDAGVYDVIVSNDCGSVTSDPAIIEVQACSPIVQIASVSAAGAEAGKESAFPSLSVDGRYVAFHSDSDLLVPGDAFGYVDVFVHDRHTGQVTWISVRQDGGHPHTGSAYPSISGHGRFVAFQSGDDQIVPDDTNGAADIFLRDRDPDENGTYDEGNAVTTRVSVSSDGVEADGASRGASISVDGGLVAFVSEAENLVPGGGSNIAHVYVRDLQTGETTRVSVDSGGNAGDDDSGRPSISADGRYVAFRSSASNLDPDDTNIYLDIFLHDRQLGTTVLVSVDSNGHSQTGENTWLDISPDGRFVAFVSEAALVPEDTNDLGDVYVRDLQAGQTVRVSVDSNGVQANGNSRECAISQDGRFITFYSDAFNLVPDDFNVYRDAFVHDRVTGETVLISRSPAGEPGDLPTGERWNSYSNRGIAISADGYYAAFFSLANNLVPNDNNDKEEVFLRDLAYETTARISVSGPGVSGSGISRYASVSVDGRFVAFQSDAENLVAGDTNEAVDVFLHDRLTQKTRRLNISPEGDQAPQYSDSGYPAISADGRYVAYYSSAENIVPGDSNGRRDIFVYSVESGDNVIVSVSSNGEQGDGESGMYHRPVALSADGRFVTFSSLATNLVPGDTNGQSDIFVHDRDPDQNGVFDEGNGITTRVSVDSQGYETNGGKGQPVISADGRYVAFGSSSTNLVPNDTNNKPDIFVHDCVSGTTERVSVSSAGEEADNESQFASITADGRYVAFASTATNLDPLDPNARWDIFLHDRQTGMTTVISLNSFGELSNGGSTYPAISAEGFSVAFQSTADNLAPGDDNGYTDVFVRDLAIALTFRVSIGAQGEEANRPCARAAISSDGGVITFQTEAWDLIPGVINRGRNVFVHQRSDCFEMEFLKPPESQTVGSGGQAYFEVTVTGNPPPTFQWRKGGADIFGATFRTLTIDHVGSGDAGIYDVVVTNAHGSITSPPAVLRVLIRNDSGGVREPTDVGPVPP